MYDEIFLSELHTSIFDIYILFEINIIMKIWYNCCINNFTYLLTLESRSIMENN